MNYHQARQVDPNLDAPDAGRWRWTNMNDGRIWPEGYCSPRTNCTECMGYGWTPPCSACDGRGWVAVTEPCQGHDSPEEAAEHYRIWCLDNGRYDLRMVEDPSLVDARHRCATCDDPTDRAAEPGGAMSGTHVWLCDLHRNPAGLGAHVERPRAITASW